MVAGEGVAGQDLLIGGARNMFIGEDSGSDGRVARVVSWLSAA